jgi:hypothetical protein
VRPAVVGAVDGRPRFRHASGRILPGSFQHPPYAEPLPEGDGAARQKGPSDEIKFIDARFADPDEDEFALRHHFEWHLRELRALREGGVLEGAKRLRR